MMFSSTQPLIRQKRLSKQTTQSHLIIVSQVKYLTFNPNNQKIWFFKQKKGKKRQDPRTGYSCGYQSFIMGDQRDDVRLMGRHARLGEDSNICYMKINLTHLANDLLASWQGKLPSYLMKLLVHLVLHDRGQSLLIDGDKTQRRKLEHRSSCSIILSSKQSGRKHQGLTTLLMDMESKLG